MHILPNKCDIFRNIMSETRQTSSMDISSIESATERKACDSTTRTLTGTRLNFETCHDEIKTHQTSTVSPRDSTVSLNNFGSYTNAMQSSRGWDILRNIICNIIFVIEAIIIIISLVVVFLNIVMAIMEVHSVKGFNVVKLKNPYLGN